MNKKEANRLNKDTQEFDCEGRKTLFMKINYMNVYTDQ